nr:glycoside hydrolase family 5 protein [Stutzerimonas urumqiensis]
MSRVFNGARKALAVSIILAASAGGLVFTPAAVAAQATASTTAVATAPLNNFTNKDWLYGMWRKSAGFSIPATSANKAAFKVGASVRFADGQVRTITKVYVAGANMSAYVDGKTLDGSKVGYPRSISVLGAGSAAAPAASAPAASTPASAVVLTSTINAFTNGDWLNGVWRKAPGVSIPATSANKGAFKVGVSIKLADGQVRKIKSVYVVGGNMSVFLEGAVLNGSTVGHPKTLAVLGAAGAIGSPAPAPTQPAASMPAVSAPVSAVVLNTSINAFTNADWLNGVWRKAPGMSIPATSANKGAFKVGVSVKLADGQVRKIKSVYVVGSNMSVFLEGAVLNGSTVGHPKTLAVLGAAGNPALVQPAAPAPAPVPAAPVNKPSGADIMLVGVNLSAAGFGPSVVPGLHGRNYSYPAESYYKKYADHGLKLVRLPFLWERIQPKLNTELNAQELARLMQSLDFAQKHGVKVILDLHNYYRYYGKLIGSSQVPISSFVGVWERLAQRVLNHPAVYGYGLMNEPHSTNGQWPQAAAAAAKAIRSIDKQRWIYVAGDRWSSAFHWPYYNTKLIEDPFMRDPKNNLVYEAHMYIDKDFSGNYFDQGEKFDPQVGVERVKPFVNWLKQNKLRGYIGEHGVPDYSASAMVAMDNLLGYLRQNCVPMTYWAAGPWWGEYSLSLDVNSGKHRPQLPILKKHAAQPNGCGSIGPM